MAEKRSRKEKTPASFSSDSPFVRVQGEVTQYPQLRQQLIRSLEEQFSAKVVTFFTSFNRPGGIISDDDAEMLEDFLAVEQVREKIVLILNSPGGQGLAAERIVNVCRAYSKNEFEVVVPHMAKSAATMICFGAKVIHMSLTAELGPVDPQLTYKDERGNDNWISAQEYLRSYEQLFDQASTAQGRIEPHLQQLQRYDSRLVEQLKSAQQLSEDISVRLLRSMMLQVKPEDEIRKDIDVFLSQKKTASHGRRLRTKKRRHVA